MLLLLVHYATSYCPKVIPSYALSCCLTAYQGSSPVARDADIILLTDNKTRLVYIMDDTFITVDIYLIYCWTQ